MDIMERVWEQELYSEIEYKRKDKLFQTFFLKLFFNL